MKYLLIVFTSLALTRLDGNNLTRHTTNSNATAILQSENVIKSGPSCTSNNSICNTCPKLSLGRYLSGIPLASLPQVVEAIASVPRDEPLSPPSIGVSDSITSTSPSSPLPDATPHDHSTEEVCSTNCLNSQNTTPALTFSTASISTDNVSSEQQPSGIPSSPTCPYSRVLHNPNVNPITPLFARPTKFECPFGELESSGRVCRQSIQSAAECTPPFERRGKQCVRYFLRELSCPEGYLFPPTPEGHCSRTIEVKAMPRCPPTFALLSDVCMRISAAPPACPAGYTPSAANPEECVQVLKKVFVDCPTGMKPRGDTCVDESFRAALPSPLCPNGFVFDQIRTICVQRSEQATRCPKGYQLEGNTCRLSGERVLSCPEGFSLHRNRPFEGKCVLSTTKPLQRTCDTAKGFELTNNQCTRLLERAPSYKCRGKSELGFHASGPLCAAKVELGRPLKTCPTDFHLSSDARYCLRRGGRCFTESQCNGRGTGCTSTVVCQEAEHTRPVESCGNDAAQILQGKCVTTKYERAMAECPIGWLHDTEKRRCVFRDASPATLGCPKEATEIQGVCSVVSIKAPSVMCRYKASEKYGSGSLAQPSADGACHLSREPHFGNGASGREVTVAPTFACSAGSFRDGLCLTRHVVPRKLVCPGDSIAVGNRCERLHQRIASQQSTIQETVPIDFSCPEDFDLKGYACERGHLLPVDSRCPRGTLAVDEERCMEVRDIVKLQPFVVRAAAMPVCPAGFVSLDQHTCSFS